MPHVHASKTARARGLVALGSLVILTLSVTLAASASGRSPATTVMTGEGETGGPMSAPVDPDHASPGAARRAALADHEHMHHGTMSSPSTSGADTSAVTAAALDPAVFGQWTTLSYKLPLRAIHATLLHTGQFLLIAGSGNVANDNIIGNFKAYLWNPTTGALTSLPVPYDAFCAGHLVDANGDVIVIGGTTAYKSVDGVWRGSNKAYKFVVATNKWVALPSMKQGRWYPTTVQDANNRVLTYSGADAAGAVPPTHEMYDPATNAWTPLANRTLPMYPSLHLLKDGRLGYTGAYYGWTNTTALPSVFAPTSTARTVVSDPNNLVDHSHRNAAMSALVGSADNQLAWVAGGLPAVRSTYFIDFNATAPTVVAGPSLAAAKGYVSVSHLPDLTALETGGGTAYNSPVYEASILNAGTRKLTAMAPPAVGRTYHSSSVTLPDGRVVTFGGDPSGDANFELRVEIFSPPYLFKGTRPTVTSAPTEVRYGTSYDLGLSGSGPYTAVLMRPGSATHSLDANQRVLKLTSSAVTGGIRVTLPSNHNLAPPGWYLLFADDSAGRPTVGRWVHLT